MAGCCGDDVFDGPAKETVDPPLLSRDHGRGIEAHVQDVDVAGKAQRNLQCVVEDGPVVVRSIDAGEHMLDAG
jgi:hypothetical protein